jgi:hypothetical protein
MMVGCHFQQNVVLWEHQMMSDSNFCRMHAMYVLYRCMAFILHFKNYHFYSSGLYCSLVYYSVLYLAVASISLNSQSLGSRKYGVLCYSRIKTSMWFRCHLSHRGISDSHLSITTPKCCLYGPDSSETT